MHQAEASVEENNSPRESRESDAIIRGQRVAASVVRDERDEDEDESIIRGDNPSGLVDDEELIIRGNNPLENDDDEEAAAGIIRQSRQVRPSIV